MKNKFSIYLSVSINKGGNDKRDPSYFWTVEQEEILKNKINAGEVIIYNPATFTIPRHNYEENYKACVKSVIDSNLVLVDARQKKGIGVGGEMMVAKYENVPVMTISPPNSHYRKLVASTTSPAGESEWIHPFIFGLSTWIVDDLEEACSKINTLIDNGKL